MTGFLLQVLATAIGVWLAGFALYILWELNHR